MRLDALVLIVLLSAPACLSASDLDVENIQFWQRLEEQVRYKEADILKHKMMRFLKKHGVERADYYADLVCAKCETDAERKLFAALLVPESRGNTKAVSYAGARGPWQVMPHWKRVFKIPGSLHDPVVNLRYARLVLKTHIEDSKGRLWGRKGAVWCYSGGSDWYPDFIKELIQEI